ncbi:MAG: glucokinase [Synechococcaceae bacterium WB4_1_0192]|nr:glucokinase [Synechococcaceae bacterium WB4_1_0192]
MSTLLAGDVGGTKTLLALYTVEGGRLIRGRSERFASADWQDFAALLNHFLAAGPPGETRPAHACLAVAGPVRGGRVKLTNLPWLLEERALAAACGLARLELVNDFAVLIYGLPHLEPDQQLTLRSPGDRDPKAPVAILGAGTGLGVAIGVPTPTGLIAIASEASHAEFAPRSDQAVDPGELPAATAAAAANADPLARAALDLWLGAYGSVAGDLALQTLCLGGLWVGGGTAGKLLSELRTPTFLQAFLNKGRLSAVVEQVPLMAVVDGDAGLFSAACRARMLLV